MRLIVAGFSLSMALPLAAFAQTSDPSLFTIEGNGGSAGAATATLVLGPDGIMYACTDVTSCSTSMAAGGSTGGAQVSHTTAMPTGDIESTCINSPLCSTIMGR